MMKFPCHVILEVVLLHFLFLTGRQFLRSFNQLNKTAAFLRELAGNRILYDLPQLSLVCLLIVVHDGVFEDGGVVKEVITVVLKVASIDIDDLLV